MQPASIAKVETQSDALASSQSHDLPSGRCVVVRIGEGQEKLEIRNPDGLVEVEVTLTEQGPRVRLRSAQLEIETPESVSVKCKQFAVEASEEVKLQSQSGVQIDGQELRVKTSDDIHMNGAMIRLNC